VKNSRQGYVFVSLSLLMLTKEKTRGLSSLTSWAVYPTANLGDRIAPYAFPPIPMLFPHYIFALSGSMNEVLINRVRSHRSDSCHNHKLQCHRDWPHNANSEAGRVELFFLFCKEIPSSPFFLKDITQSFYLLIFFWFAFFLTLL
jgi:hypothetical protein